MADDRNYIDKERARGVEFFGRDLTSDELAIEFAKSDVYARSQQLSTIKAELPTDMSPREAARRFADIRALDDMHRRLKEVDR